MLAVTSDQPGGPGVLKLSEVPDPHPRANEVVVDVVAAGVNRADLLQREGRYPPPTGASPYLGLECSGLISAVGADVVRWNVGDAVCALLAGGGYAERVAVPQGQLMPVPPGVSILDAAALPEVTCTVWSNLVMLAGLSDGETVLVHGGGSGIGTMAIQVAALVGARSIVTCGSLRKTEACLALGASVAVNYREQDWLEAVKGATAGQGVHVVLDVIGAKYLENNLLALASGGRLVVIGLQGGLRAELDLGRLLSRRLAVHGTTLRSRPLSEKDEIVDAVIENVWPAVAGGRVRPVIDRVLPWDEVAEAHGVLERGDNVGKVLLQVVPS
ncbi:MAG: NAD(P)H-quinone oxidoreductase [Actinomycetes bacterium]